MCPIETPEGPNIGLINTLSTFAKVNKFGFIETPYRRVDPETGLVTSQIDYLTADEEDNYVVAQANSKLNDDGSIIDITSCEARQLSRALDLIGKEREEV